MSVIIGRMAATAPTTPVTAWDEQFADVPALRADWCATALARAVSLAVVRHRVEHGLTQTALGRQLGMPQAQVSRIEAGDHTPSLETLQRLCDALDLEIDLSIRPRADERRPAPRGRRNAIVETTDRLVIAIRPARGER